MIAFPWQNSATTNVPNILRVEHLQLPPASRSAFEGWPLEVTNQKTQLTSSCRKFNSSAGKRPSYFNPHMTRPRSSFEECVRALSRLRCATRTQPSCADLQYRYRRLLYSDDAVLVRRLVGNPRYASVGEKSPVHSLTQTGVVRDCWQGHIGVNACFRQLPLPIGSTIVVARLRGLKFATIRGR